MYPGTAVPGLVADRFDLLRLAGEGGMGAVYHARDRANGEAAAVKILRHVSAGDVARFEREARVLAGLAHPSIVRYVAHGRLGDGSLYLAMEWLEGEDLEARLRRRPLSLAEVVTLARRTAAGLAAAHARGIVHRDVKPSNLFLPGGDVERVKVLDFGIARSVRATQVCTETGDIIGTVGFMAPEQARGERTIGPGADVFGLGCVLYECVTGVAAFTGSHQVAVLAKVLLDDPPRVGELRPEAAGALDDLIDAMLRKDPAARPRDGEAVLAALAGVEAADLAAPRAAPRPRTITSAEQRLVSIMLLGLPDMDLHGEDPTLTPEMVNRCHAPVREIIEPLGGRVAALTGGPLLVVLEGRARATDQAARVASCALSVCAAVPGAWGALATGRADLSARWPVGRVIERAATLLQLAADRPAGGVLIDRVTADLLDARFVLHREGEVARLLREEHVATDVRRLLGTPTRCVGRDRELAFLEGVLADCGAEPAAQAVVVTARAGAGKSRLRHEFLARVEEQGTAQVLIARGDPVQAGSAFSLTAQLVRQGVGLQEGTAAAQQYATLTAAVGGLVPGPSGEVVAEFLGELVGAASGGKPSPQLVAARHDPRIMGEQIEAAFATWVGALCDQRPLILVLEDLHWGDLPTVRLVEKVLRERPAAPLLILALARPEVDEVFPALWTEAGTHRLSLAPLLRRSAEELVRSVLGPNVAATTVDRIVTQAAGNAFYLEELIRHVARGDDGAFPETVLAMAESRLATLEDVARRMLRGASLFGEVFWAGGLQALLGGTVSPDDLTAWLEALVTREILTERRHGKFPGERELSFRHGLLREAAYATLTDEDREAGHALAADWLERTGEKDSFVLAEHFARGGLPDRAVAHYLRAVHIATTGRNLPAVREIARRGLACDAAGESRGLLLLHLAVADMLGGDSTHLAARALAAVPLLRQGSTAWAVALGALSFAGTYGGEAAALTRAIELLETSPAPLDGSGPAGFAGVMMFLSLLAGGLPEAAQRVAARLEQAAAASADPVFAGYLQLLPAVASLYGHGGLGAAVDQAERALQLFGESRDHVSAANATFFAAWAHLETGAGAHAAALCRTVIDGAERTGTGGAAAWATYFLGLALAHGGDPDAARAAVRPVRDARDPLVRHHAQLVEALAELGADRPAESARICQAILDEAHALPMLQVETRAVLATALLRQGQSAAAASCAQQGLEQRSTVGCPPSYEALLRASGAEALAELGDREATRAAVRAAHAWLRGLQATFTDDASRDAFVRGLPPYPRLAALAATWLTPEELGGAG